MLDNQYTSDVRSLFEIQLELLKKHQKNPSITNQNRFFDFISQKWKTEG